jgi:hypothetical protein
MLRLAIALGLAAAVVGIVAEIDHDRKGDRANAAQESAWFCKHGRASACSDFDQVAHEERWERRERRYELGFGALAAGAVVLALGALLRRRPVRE